MTVREIVKAWLEQNGYDGLVERDGECACGLDDLAPCGDEGWVLCCEAGHEAACDGTCDEGKCDFHIVPGKAIGPGGE